MSLFHALVLGVVEGLTEFLPVSSTGHLILVSGWLGLSGEAVKTFDVVIQAGALAAVVVLYRARLTAMKGPLFRNLAISFFPAAVAGLLFHKTIKAHLFGAGPVVAALAAGGVFMLALDVWLRKRSPRPSLSLEALTARQALVIGLAQCLSLWPGTSRAMVTMAAGLLLGLPPVAAAEYSFLLALPTLGAATLFDAVQGGAGWIGQVGPLAVAAGFLGSALTAALAIRGFIRWLTRRGLAPFGWYRLGLAGLVWKNFS